MPNDNTLGARLHPRSNFHNGRSSTARPVPPRTVPKGPSKYEREELTQALAAAEPYGAQEELVYEMLRIARRMPTATLVELVRMAKEEVGVRDDN